MGNSRKAKKGLGGREWAHVMLSKSTVFIRHKVGGWLLALQERLLLPK